MNERYNDFLNSADWKSFAEQLKIKRGGKCEICGSDERLEVHHLRYVGNLMEEDDVKVLCHSCHECMERMIGRFQAQTTGSYLMSIETYRDLFKRSLLDFFQNSIFKPASKATVMLNIKHYTSLRLSMVRQLALRFPEMEVMIDYRHIRSICNDYVPAITLEESGIVRWRNNLIKEATAAGASRRSIQERFRISDQALYKALR